MKKPLRITEEKLETIINDLAEGIEPRATTKQLYAAIDKLASQRAEWAHEALRLSTGIEGIGALVRLYEPKYKTVKP